MNKVMLGRKTFSYPVLEADAAIESEWKELVKKWDWVSVSDSYPCNTTQGPYYTVTITWGNLA